MSVYNDLSLVRSPGAMCGRVGKHLYLLQVLFFTCPRFREEAYSLMSKSPFFGTWDPDVLRNYVDYALVEDSSGKVRLKCSNIQVRRKRNWLRGVASAETSNRKRWCLLKRYAVSRRGRFCHRSTGELR
jgi:hypothetical protein